MEQCKTQLPGRLQFQGGVERDAWRRPHWWWRIAPAGADSLETVATRIWV
jgi:hypothetical protein